MLTLSPRLGLVSFQPLIVKEAIERDVGLITFSYKRTRAAFSASCCCFGETHRFSLNPKSRS